MQVPLFILINPSLLPAAEPVEAAGKRLRSFLWVIVGFLSLPCQLYSKGPLFDRKLVSFGCRLIGKVELEKVNCR